MPNVALVKFIAQHAHKYVSDSFKVDDTIGALAATTTTATSTSAIASCATVPSTHDPANMATSTPPVTSQLSLASSCEAPTNRIRYSQPIVVCL